MEDYLPEKVADVVARVKDALWEFPGPVHRPREEFFAVDNLWTIEIPSTCRQAIEYVRSVMLLIDQGMNRPAAALSRSVHECYIRFEYLAAHEDELPDWFAWQISRDYHAACDTLRDFGGLSQAHKQHLQGIIEDIKDLLREAPSKSKGQWKGTGYMLKDIASRFEAGSYGPLYRQLIADPSDYVHIHASGGPSWMVLMELTEISFAATIKRAMQLCISKQLIGTSAAEIEVLCDGVLPTAVAP